MKKNIKIKFKVKPIWKIGKGHNEDISGSGEHDSRPKRVRTRNAELRQALKDYKDYNDYRS